MRLRTRAYGLIALSVILLGCLLFTSACGGGGGGASADQDSESAVSTGSPTDEQDAGATMSPTATSRPSPSPTPTPLPDVTSLPEVATAQAHMEQENFRQALVTFQILHERYDDETTRLLLAQVLFDWGKHEVDHSGGNPSQISQASTRFIYGLDYTPEGSEIQSDTLKQKNMAQHYVQGMFELRKIQSVKDDTEALAGQEDLTKTMLEHFAFVWENDPEYPGLYENYAQALLLTANVYEALGDRQEDLGEQKRFWEIGFDICADDRFDPESEEGKLLMACKDDLDLKIHPPTPTPTPLPTTPPDVVIPDLRGLDINVAEAQLQSLGLQHVNTEDNDGSGVCAGQVTYSSPPAGTSVSPGSEVRLFYRSFNRPGCN